MMKKYRTKSMANGGKTKLMPSKVKVPGATVPGATVVAKKGEGIKMQGFGTKEYSQRRDDLMGIEVAKFMEGKPKSYKISDAERSNIKAKVREELIKGGQQFYAPVFRDTGKKLTPANIAKAKQIEEERRKRLE